jgi:hypothetical protein
MNQLEYYDLRAEENRLRQMENHFERCRIQGLAEQAALMEHPVVSYVKNLPVESPSYPAIEYLKLAQQVGRPVQEVYSLVQEGNTDFRDQDGNHIHFRKEDHEYIHWSMPGRDRQRPIDKGCGFIHAKSGGIVHTRCPDHPEHYCKGKRHHCWSMACYECMNDTALRQGVKVETKLKAFKRLHEKQGEHIGDIGHWVVSPPQELVKCLMQTRREFDNLARYVEASLQDVGASAGITIFHPWRMKDDHWELSPHFHNLLYGRLDTDKFLRDNPGWIIKKVHPREKIRSIRHTAAYLFTHMGIGLSEVDPDTVDWELDFLDHMIPGIKSPGAHYTEKDYEKLSNGKGRLVGDMSDIDWEKWTTDRLSRELRVRQWGGVARNKMRTLGIHRQYKIRVCKECGEILRTYEGSNDSIGNYVRYIQDNQIFTLAHNFDLAYTAYLRYKDDLMRDGLSLSDFASMVPFAVSTLEILPQNSDLVMSGPFEEPDEYFLRRQKAAFGAESLS